MGFLALTVVGILALTIFIVALAALANAFR